MSALEESSSKTWPVPLTTKSSDLLALLLPDKPNDALKQSSPKPTCNTTSCFKKEALTVFPWSSWIVMSLLKDDMVRCAPATSSADSPSLGASPFNLRRNLLGGSPVFGSASVVTVLSNFASTVSSPERTANLVMIVACAVPTCSATACTVKLPHPAQTASPRKLHSKDAPSMLWQCGSPHPPPTGRGIVHFESPPKTLFVEPTGGRTLRNFAHNAASPPTQASVSTLRSILYCHLVQSNLYQASTRLGHCSK
mmetsp:Transcript_44634/g.112148  ORF Transcript_44634/g.112148 Transcript_44634/m.112148 type:complete len:253 (-) Transcript_44634:471-1229(-)